MLSYARIDGPLSKAQANHFRSLGAEVHKDPRGSTILTVDHGDLDSRLKNFPTLSAVNNRLNERHQSFAEQLAGVLDEESIKSGRIYIDALLLDGERMNVEGGKVNGFALVGRNDGTFEVMNEGTLAQVQPYISGYGSLLNPTELVYTYGAHVDLADDNMFWIIAKGFQVIMDKVPTRDFWTKDPATVAQSGVLNIRSHPEGKFVAIVYDANSERREPHKTFMRETDYRFYEIPPENIEQIVSDRREPFDTARPIFGVMAHKVKVGPGGVFDIQASSDAHPILRYNTTIIRGLSLAADAERATPGVEVGDLLSAYAGNTIMPDGQTLLSSRNEFKGALEKEKASAEATLVSIARTVMNLYRPKQR